MERNRRGRAPSPNGCVDAGAAGEARACAAPRDSAVGRRDRLKDLDPSGAGANTRCGLLARMTLIAGLPGSNKGRPACDNRSAVTFGAATRIHTSTCRAPRPRSNSMACRSSSRNACMSGPSAVSIVRPFMAQPACGRHNETRWLQLSRVVDSDANNRMCSRGSIRMPPRAVTAATRASPFERATASCASRSNSAIAPNVPKLQFAS